MWRHRLRPWTPTGKVPHGMVRISLVIWALALGLLGGIAAPEPIQVQHLAEGGYQIENSLVRYQFLEQGGVLQRAFVHFASYGDYPMETVPSWASKDSLVPGASLPFEVWAGDVLTDQTPYQAQLLEDSPERVQLGLSCSEPGIAVEKSFTVANDAIYTMDVGIHIRAQGEDIRIVLGHRPSGKDAPQLLFLYDGKPYTNPLAPGSYSRFEGLGLVGRDTVYFLRLSEAGDFVPFLGANQAGQPMFGLRAEALEGETTLAGFLYTGRNRYLLLQDAGLENLVSPSLGSRFLIGVMQFLELLYQATGNYGWAIILFTLVVYLILYPLNRSQIRSMAKMKKIGPKLQKLQERYKDDRETLQKQMMELYRQEGVNPMGGCLPMLLQLPIFMLLWYSIRLSAEHFHLAPGFLWMPNLSQPDPYYIMLILNVGAMLFQTWYTQRRTPTGAQGMGQAIGYIFPLFMVIIFWNFPAGMWLYWLLSTVFRVIQQAIAEWELERGSRPRPQE